MGTDISIEMTWKHQTLSNDEEFILIHLIMI